VLRADSGRWARRLAGGVLALLTAACAVLPPEGAEPTESPLPEPAPAFDAAGRLAVRGPDNAFSGAFRWRHAPGNDLLELSSPFGQKLAELAVDADGARLVTAQGERHNEASLDALAARVLGVELPLAHLPAWLQGLPDRTRPYSVRRDGEGRVASVRQAGWEVQVLDFAPGAARPRRLLVRQGEVEVRLALDSFEAR
jgi:outer membrane lipoprotein LolB